jgi:transposase
MLRTRRAARGQDHSRLLLGHLRREFFKIAERGDAPIASEAVARIAQIYAIEKDVRGTSADERRTARQIRSRRSWRGEPII